jgi:hypothetical protein
MANMRVPLHSDFDWLSGGGTKPRMPMAHISTDRFKSLQGSISKSQNHCAEVLGVSDNVAVSVFGGTAALMITRLIAVTGYNLGPAFCLTAGGVIGLLEKLPLRSRFGGCCAVQVCCRPVEDPNVIRPAIPVGAGAARINASSYGIAPSSIWRSLSIRTANSRAGLGRPKR